MTSRTRTFWSEEETNAIMLGVARHGVGRWAESLFNLCFQLQTLTRAVKHDPEFKQVLQNRTTVNIKDKHRNLARDQTKPPKRQKQSEPPAPLQMTSSKLVEKVQKQLQAPSQLIKLTLVHLTTMDTITVALLGSKPTELLLKTAIREFALLQSEEASLELRLASTNKVLDLTKPVCCECAMFDLIHVVVL